MYQRILVPLDGSAAAEEALPHALEIAQHFGGHLILLRVVEPVIVSALPSFTAPVVSMRDHPGDNEAATAYLEERARALEAQGASVETVVLHGPTADEILMCAHDRQADLIVMTTTGHGGLVRLIAGSTAESVLARAEVPMLVVRPTATRRD